MGLQPLEPEKAPVNSKNWCFWVRNSEIEWKQNERPSYISRYVSYNNDNFGNDPSKLTEEDACRVAKTSFTPCQTPYPCDRQLHSLDHSLYRSCRTLLFLYFSDVYLFRNQLENDFDDFQHICSPGDGSKNHDKIWRVDLHRYDSVLLLCQF